MRRKMAFISAIFVQCILGLTLGAGWGEGQTQVASALSAEAARMDTFAATQWEITVVNKLSAELEPFLGADARAVVIGLRTGKPITLKGPPPSRASGDQTATTTVIKPPTGRMSYSNVFISLALARQHLGRLDITQPTPQQLRSTLVGGHISFMSARGPSSAYTEGILTMKSQNMGWARIANGMGVKLGPVVSGLRAANQAMVTGTSASASGVVRTSSRSIAPSQGGIAAESGRSSGPSVEENSRKGYGK